MYVNRWCKHFKSVAISTGGHQIEWKSRVLFKKDLDGDKHFESCFDFKDDFFNFYLKPWALPIIDEDYIVVLKENDHVNQIFREN